MSEKIDLSTLIAPKLVDPRLLGFHVVFLVAGGLLLFADTPVPVGWRLFFAGLVYNLAFPLFAASCVEPRWIRMWSFLFPLSILQILPDWHLAANLGTLIFPDLGFPKIGPVSLFMGLLWIVPLLLVVDFAERLIDRYGPRIAALGAAGLALLLFGAAEATLTLIPVWHAQNVLMVGPVALYVLLPEAILGAATWWTFRQSQKRPVLYGLLGAVAVMTLYAVSLTVSWWLFGFIS